jgi:cyanate lyase
MTKLEMTEKILASKISRHVTWTEIAHAAGLSEVYTTSACLGENALSKEEAGKVGALLGSDPAVIEALTRPVTKGGTTSTIPRDPLLYRFQEVLNVYGGTLKELIEEKFGPGIMSAVDFTMSVEKRQDPAGDRVVVTMNGKFLPYKKW